MNNNKKIYFFSVFSKITLVIIGLLTSALISRGLGVNLKGEYSYLVNFSSILVIIATMGIGQTYSYFIRQYGNKYKSIFINLNYLQLIFLLFIFCIFCFIDKQFYKNLILLCSFGMFRDNFVYLSTVEDIKKRNILNLISKTLYLLLIVIGYIFFKYNLNIFIYLLLFDEFIFSLLLVLKYKFYPQKTSLTKSEKNRIIKKIYKLGIISMITLLMTTLNYSIDTILLKNMSTSTSVGLYSIGTSLANMLWIIPDAFKEVLLNKTSKNDSIDDIVFSLKSNIFISFIIIIAFSFLGKFFIAIVYGQEFLNSFFSTIILFFGSLSMIFHKIISPLLYSKGFQKKLCIIFFEAVILNVILNIILIPSFDIIGAAVSSVFSYTLAGGSILLMFSKMYNLKIKNIIFVNKNDLRKLMKTIGGE